MTTAQDALVRTALEVQRPLFDVTLPPDVAFLLARDYPEAVRHLEAKGHSFAAAGQRDRAGRFLRSVALIREASRRWLEAQPAQRAPEPRQAGAKPKRFVGITSAEAAERLEVTPRRVIDMIGGPLVGEKVKGRWVIDELSVRDEVKRRRDA